MNHDDDRTKGETAMPGSLAPGRFPTIRLYTVDPGDGPMAPACLLDSWTVPPGTIVRRPIHGANPLERYLRWSITTSGTTPGEPVGAPPIQVYAICPPGKPRPLDASDPTYGCTASDLAGLADRGEKGILGDATPPSDDPEPRRRR